MKFRSFFCQFALLGIFLKVFTVREFFWLQCRIAGSFWITPDLNGNKSTFDLLIALKQGL